MTTPLDIAEALVVQTLSCPCDTPGVPLCVACACLLTVVQAVLDGREETP